MDFRYTGQRSPSDVGRLDYRARFYDPTIGRFIQPDSIIPSYANPQSLNRFSYVLNNPILLNDPSGHFGKCREGMSGYQCRIRMNKVEQLEAEWRAAPAPAAAPGRGEEEGAGALGPPNNVRTTLSGPEDGIGQFNLMPLDASANTLEAGYVGPIPESIRIMLIGQGADPDLVNGVTIRIPEEGCYPNCRKAATTWFNEITYKDAYYYNNPASPNGILLHELVHVRQFRDGGNWFALKLQFGILRENIHEWIDPKYSRYANNGYWVEVEGARCGEAWRADSSTALNASPCNLR
jgi:RHS repeat-associated protein